LKLLENVMEKEAGTVIALGYDRRGYSDWSEEPERVLKQVSAIRHYSLYMFFVL
jgi:hypothetical protein